MLIELIQKSEERILNVEQQQLGGNLMRDSELNVN